MSTQPSTHDTISNGDNTITAPEVLSGAGSEPGTATQKQYVARFRGSPRWMAIASELAEELSSTMKEDPDFCLTKFKLKKSSPRRENVLRNLRRDIATHNLDDTHFASLFDSMASMETDQDGIEMPFGPEISGCPTHIDFSLPYSLPPRCVSFAHPRRVPNVATDSKMGSFDSDLAEMGRADILILARQFEEDQARDPECILESQLHLWSQPPIQPWHRGVWADFDRTPEERMLKDRLKMWVLGRADASWFNPEPSVSTYNTVQSADGGSGPEGWEDTLKGVLSSLGEAKE